MGNTKQLAKRVTKWRNLRGLTQQEVADKLNLSRQRYILVEKGQRDLSTVELIILSDLFGIQPDDLLRDPVDIDKFRQMYFACIKYAYDESCEGVKKTKLAKLLYLADFSYYYRHKQPMSGVRYRCMEYGPVADIFFTLTDDLYSTGKIDVTFGERAHVITPTTREKDNFDRLSDEEIELIQDICKVWKNKRTIEIVNFTHEQLPWSSCKDGEFIPYDLILEESPDHIYKPS